MGHPSARTTSSGVVESLFRIYYLRVFWRLLIAAFFCLSVTAHAKITSQQGSICGVFQDENGLPAADTWMTAIYIGSHSGPFSGSKTDADGRYCITGLSLGEYAVSADDEKKGYPLLNIQFFTQRSREPRVTLTTDVPNAHIDGRIPFKAGFLSLVLMDSEAGKPIASMSVNLSVRSDPDHRWMHINTISDRILLIPPNEDVYVTVTSPGFSTWPDDGSKGALLNFLPGQRQTLRISLREVK
jgi:hypothetical protein